MSYQPDSYAHYDAEDYPDYAPFGNNILASPSPYTRTLPIAAPPMDRGRGLSESSSRSNYSGFSTWSPGMSFQSPITEVSYTGSPEASPSYLEAEFSVSPYDEETPTYAAVTSTAGTFSGNSPPSQGSQPRLPDFDPRQGDQRISWQMYYKFDVTRAGPLWRLVEGYISSDAFPVQIPCEETFGPDDKRNFRCLQPNCISNPFRRLHDLRRHFRSMHGDETAENYYCDYKNCQHKSDPFERKDHCREHYREYHNEDLIKRKMSEKELADFMAARTAQLQGDWWRCTKCLSRVKTSSGYTCSCGRPCEAERQAARKAGQPKGRRRH